MSQVCGVFVRAWRTFGYNRSRAPGAAARGALRDPLRPWRFFLLPSLRTCERWSDGMICACRL